jgi:hypothetical protein
MTADAFLTLADRQMSASAKRKHVTKRKCAQELPKPALTCWRAEQRRALEAAYGAPAAALFDLLKQPATESLAELVEAAASSWRSRSHRACRHGNRHHQGERRTTGL